MPTDIEYVDFMPIQFTIVLFYFILNMVGFFGGMGRVGVGGGVGCFVLWVFFLRYSFTAVKAIPRKQERQCPFDHPTSNRAYIWLSIGYFNWVCLAISSYTIFLFIAKKNELIAP